MSILYYNQQVMDNTGLPTIEGSEQNVDTQHPLLATAERALTTVKTATKAGVFAISVSLAGVGAATAEEEAQPEEYVQLAANGEIRNDAMLVPVGLSEDPAFQTMIDNGFEAGDRGVDQPNRFDDPMEEFLSFTQVSQDFILRAFTAGQLTESPNSRSLDVNNGILAIVLIDLVGDMETLARFIETREIPESGHLPRIDTTLERLLRNAPNVAEVITPDMQARIAELEAETDRVLAERLAEEQEETARLQAVNEGLRDIERRMQALYDATNT